MINSEPPDDVGQDGFGPLVEQVTRRLEAEGQIDWGAVARDHPQHMDRLRELLPVIQTMVELGNQPPDLSPRAPSPGEIESQIPADKRLGDFEILEEIGRGGMGIVHKARQISLNRLVALKMLPFATLADKGLLLRFQNEARAAATLHHPHIVPVYWVGCERGVHFYAMEYIDGPNLAKVVEAMRSGDATEQSLGGSSPLDGIRGDAGTDDSLRKHGETLGTAAATTGAMISVRSTSKREYFRTIAVWGSQVAAALAYAHENGIVHRDIKPSNLLLDDKGQVLITDFGLARLAEGESVTMTGDRAGTLRYMSPERATSNYWDHRTDVFSLGVTLYELLTLTPPFGGSNRHDVLREIVNEEPSALRQIEPAIPVDLQTIVLKAIEKRPEDRYAMVQAMAEDLRRFLHDEPIQAKPPTLRDRLVKWSRRHTTLVRAAAVFSALLLAVLSVGSAMLARAAQNAAVAERRAVQSAAIATREKQEALQNLYRANVQIAHYEWADGRVDRTLNLLEAVRPSRGGADYRNWEWYYVRSLCHGGESIDGQLIGSAPSCPLRLICRVSGDTCTFTDWESGDVRLVLPGEDGLRTIIGPKGRRLARPAGPAGFNALFGAAESVSNSLQLYDLVSRVKKWEKRLTPVVDELDWSPSGDRIVTVHRGGRVNVWDANNGSLVVEMDGDAGGDWFANVKWSPDGRWIAAGHGIWDAASGKEAFREVTQSDAYKRASGLALDWDPSRRRIATINDDHDQLSVWDLDSDKPLLTLRPHPGWISWVSWSPDGKSIATAGGDALVKIWDAASGQLVNEFRGHTGHIYSLRWIDGGQRLASIGSGRTRIWDPDAEQGYLSLPADGPIAWTPSGRLVACSQNKNGRTYDFFDPDTGNLTASIEDNEVASNVVCVSVDHAGRRLATSNTNGNLRYWDINTGKLLGAINANSVETRCIAWNADGSMLATSGDDGFKVWDLKNQQMVAHLIIDDRRLPLDGSSVIWSPDGRTLVGVKMRDIRVWSTDDWQEVADIRTRDGGGHDVNGLSWSPSGDRFVSCTGRFINIWEATTGSNVMEIKAHNTEVTSVTWSPDGKRIASGGRDHLIKLWDADTSEDMLTLRGHEDAVIQLVWSPDGRKLASSDGNSARIWDATAGYVRVGN